MKKTQILDALRNIRKEFVAYLSILVIGLLATLAYLCVAYTADCLKKDALAFFNNYRLWDLEISSTLLMGEGDLEAIRAVGGVEEAEAVWQIDAAIERGDKDEPAAVISRPVSISLPMLTAGRLPEAAGECAVEQKLMDACGFTLGQRINVNTQQLSGIDPLLEKSFVITGAFETPDHISYMIAATPYVIVCPEAFNREELGGAFMKTRVRVANAPADRYGDAYREAVSPVEQAILAMAEERARLRRQELCGGYEQQIADGRDKLDEAAEQLAAARRDLDEGWEQLNDARGQLEDVRQQLDAGGQLLTEAEFRIESVKGLMTKVDGVLSALDEETMAELKELFPGLSGLVQQYKDGISQYSAGRLQWYAAGEEYLDALTQFESGLKRLEDGESRYEDGKRQYEEGLRQIEQAEEQLAAIGPCRWVVLNDRGNPGFMYAEANFEKLSSLSMSFSLIFLIVGALVIYATIGRMVEEQKRIVGASKAMGLYNREIFAKYLFFACSAVLLGVGVGVLLAWLPLQRLILRSYEALMRYGVGTYSFLPRETVLVVAGALGISVAAVYLGCVQLLRQPALRLIQGSLPSAGRKKARRSAKKSLYSRLILLNMRSDLSRVAVTTVSIAGGCMLLVIGFTLRYGISAVTARQFGEIQTYEAEIYFNANENPNAAEEIEAILDRSALPHIRALKKDGVFEMNETLNAVTLVAAEQGSLEGFFALRGLDGAALDTPEGGLLIPRRFCEHYGVGVGESVAIYDAGMNLRRVQVAAVFENYFGQLFFLSPQSYEAAFSAPAEPNCLFVRTNGMGLEELESAVKSVSGFTGVKDAAASRTLIEQFTASLGIVVWIMLFIAGLMSCFIVANFTMTYIQRKTRELTIMRINGFTNGECVRYAAVDLIITTVLGAALGMVCGRYMGHAILRTTETPYIQMIREPVYQTYLYSALITCGFSLVINTIALRRIRDLRLTNLD